MLKKVSVVNIYIWRRNRINGFELRTLFDEVLYRNKERINEKKKRGKKEMKEEKWPKIKFKNKLN